MFVAEGHASITRPPVDPHPVEPDMSVDGVIISTLEVASPASVTVTALALHAFPPIAVVAFVKVVFAIPGVAQFAFPLAAIPVAKFEPVHCEGVAASAVAVAALPVVF